MVRSAPRPERVAARLRRVGLGTKVSVTACLVVTALLTSFTSVLLRHDRRLLEDELAQKARILAKGVAHATELGLLTNNLGLQREGARSAEADPDLLVVQVFDRGGAPTVAVLHPGAKRALASVGIHPADRLPSEHVVWRPSARRPRVVGYRVEVAAPPATASEALLLEPPETPSPEGSGASGAVQVWLSTARIDTTFAVVRRRLLLATAGAVAWVWILTVVAVRRLMRPIHALVEAMGRVARGERVERLPARSRDEIGQLTRRFNAMAADLAAYRAAQAATQAELERRVEERTADLELERDRAQEAVRARTAFLANTSHELITPLNAILGFTELIEREAHRLPPSVRRDLGRIHRSALHLQELIQQLLDYSRMEAGRLTLRLEAVDLRELLEDCLTSTVLLSKHEGVVLRREIPESLPRVEADPVRLRQAFLNLLSNAVKFTEEGAITVRARDLGDRVACEVEDTGIGIAEEDYPKVFAEFVQVDDSLARRYGGLGLGLAITKEIVERHGGEITFTSTLGEGSCFTITLPVRHDPPPREDKENP
ncbi:MAG: HAMP domain-containing protein [Nitrospirae bacterium]|nr:MAG: HAMP domain-containing protein [Nitrospirota bacterium]